MYKKSKERVKDFFKRAYNKIIPNKDESKKELVETSKKKTYIIIGLIIALLILIVVVINVGMYIRFLVQDEFQIVINPINKIIETDDRNIPLGFEIKTNNVRFCKTICELNVIDAYEDMIIYSGKTDMVIDKSTDVNFTLELDTDGYGERVYYLEAFCNNQKSFFCKTSEEKKYRSSLITIKHNYTSEKIKEKEELKELIKNKHKSLVDAKNEERYYNGLIDSIYDNIDNSLKKKDIVDEEFKKVNEAKEYFELQDFEKSRFGLEDVNIPSIENDITAVEDSITGFNSNVELLDSLSDEKYNKIYGFFINTKSNESIVMKNLYNNLDKDIKNKNITFESISEFDGIDNYIYTLDNIEKRYDDELDKAESDAKKRILSYQHLMKNVKDLNLTGNVCNNIGIVNNIIDEHNDDLIDIDDLNQSEINITNESIILLDNLIEFTEDNLFDIYENSTHLFNSENESIERYDNSTSYSISDLITYIELKTINDDFCKSSNQKLFYGKLINITKIDIITIYDITENITINEPVKLCCIDNSCSPCLKDNIPHPVIFLHGHAFNMDDPPEASIQVFTKIRKGLSDENIIINGGDIDYTSIDFSPWTRINKTIGLSATYYYISYYDTGIITKTVKNDEGIESYSLRLKEIIDMTLEQSGSDKVIIIAHSMGGLVTRNYLKTFGEDKVEKIMLIGTPNNGITGRISTFCPSLGGEKECEDMKKDSVFIKRLDLYEPKIPFKLIVGTGCNTDGKDGDGVVQKESSELFGDMYDITYINGTCSSFIGTELHGDLVDPTIHPEVYEIVKEFVER